MRRQPHLPPTGFLIGDDTLEQVDRYHYWGILVTSKVSWADHMLYRQFCAWADTKYMAQYLPNLHTSTLRTNVCQLWDPYTTKGIHSLESVYRNLLAKFKQYDEL